MSVSAMNRLIGEISRSVAAERLGELPDVELLQRIITGDAVALEAAVRRHGGMVLAAARAILTDEADIDDAFQASFLALWRNGGRIRKGASLGPWLFGVARRAALKALTRARRRFQVESSSDHIKLSRETDPSWREVCRILYEEIERLPEQYRGPIVQCYLEGRSRDEAASDLGWKLTTLRGRLERGREMLKRRLTQRGVALSIGCMAWLVEDGSAPANDLPAALVGTTVRMASSTGARAPAAVIELLPERSPSILPKIALGAALLLTAGLLTAHSGDIRHLDNASPISNRAIPIALILDGEPTEPSPKAALAGTWIVDSAFMGKDSRLRMVWGSKLSVAGESFTLSKFLDPAKDLKGSFAIDPGVSPKKVDLKIEELDLSATGMPVKVPAGTLLGIYKLEGGRLTICFNQKPGGERPKNFNLDSREHCQLSFQRAAAGFKEFPKQVKIKVVAPDGKPAAGATVAGFMSMQRYLQKNNEKPEWVFADARKTDKDGTVKMPFDNMASDHLIVRDGERKLMAFVGVSPASLVSGEVTVTLAPERSVVGTIVCPELIKAGKPISWTSAYLMHNGDRVAYCNAPRGEFEFVVPAGSYTIHAYGSDFHGKNVSITVPADPSQFVVEPIELTASGLILLEGKPAPEPKGVIGWKGRPTKLADLKGKYVLLEFWGWWCGPCVGAMPTLIELHERFADKGLAIVGIHMDVDGEIDTPAKLDDKLVQFRKDLWHGKDIPFPVAIVPGREVGEGDEKFHSESSRQYGVISYPTTILIDREGNVVGRFGARDIKDAAPQIEKLLGEKK